MAHANLPKKPPPENRARLPAARHGGNAGVAPLVADPSVPAAVNTEMGENGAVSPSILAPSPAGPCAAGMAPRTAARCRFGPDRF